MAPPASWSGRWWGVLGGSLALAALLTIVVPAGAQEYVVDLEAPRSVRFVSRTSLQTFDGTSERIDGYLWLGEGASAASVAPGADLTRAELYFEADLAALDTGISLRDRHMREDYLRTDDYPFATFRGRIANIAEAGDGDLRITSPGYFTVHGVERERTLTCVARPVDEGFDVSCAFPVRLEEHDIEIPRVMFVKLASEVRVEVAFTLRSPDRGELP